MSYVKSFSSLSSCVKEEAAMVLNSKKQGIVSILDSDQKITRTSASLRRTLSADMSSKNWQIQNGLKKTASTQTFQTLLPTSPDSSSISSFSSSSDGEEDQQPAQLDLWTAITSKKIQEDDMIDVPAPYIHPLVKTSSSLSEKSLEICTESLGSETGSDCFSSYPASEAGSDAEEAEKEVEQEAEQKAEQKTEQKTEQETEHPKNTHHQEQEDRVEENNFLAPSGCKKLAQRSLPPPISSLSSQNGVSLQMRSRRDNGRLVLEAVSVPPQNNFLAQRQDGRLVLTLINTQVEENEEEGKKVVEAEIDQFAVEIENLDDNQDVEEETEETEEEEKMRGGGGEEEVRFVMEEAPKLGGGLISVHRLAMGMNRKSKVLTNRNPVVWPNEFYESDKFGNDRDEIEEEEDDDVEVVFVGPKISPMTQSLPPRPKVAVGRMMPSAAMVAPPPPMTASYNAYECLWKTKSISTTSAAHKAAGQVLGTNHHHHNNNKQFFSKNTMPNESQGKSIARGGECKLGPLGNGCKEARRRSLLFWEQSCIATS